MFSEKEQKAVLFLIFIIIVGISIILLRDYQVRSSLEIIKGRQSAGIFVCGEVVHPGIYKVSISDSIGCILKRAGICKSASKKIIFSILSCEWPMNGPVNVPVNINIASKEELENLPTIGPKLALNIIEYREKHGNFKDKEEIMKVKGIGSKKFQLISNSIFVSEKEIGKIPIYLEIELRGVKKEGIYRIRSSNTISEVLDLGGEPAEGMDSRFLKFEVK